MNSYSVSGWIDIIQDKPSTDRPLNKIYFYAFDLSVRLVVDLEQGTWKDDNLEGNKDDINSFIKLQTFKENIRSGNSRNFSCPETKAVDVCRVLKFESFTQFYIC